MHALPAARCPQSKHPDARPLLTSDDLKAGGVLCCYLGVSGASKIENFLNIGTVNGHNGGNIGRHNIADVTNYVSMKAAADKAEGPVCIAMEGLTVYLSPEEMDQLMTNIRRILVEKGGCWLSSDAETFEYHMAELLMAARKGFGGQSDTDLHKNNASVVKNSDGKKMAVDYEKIEAKYKSKGLLVEKIPYYRDDLELRLFDAMTEEEIEKLKENMKHVNVWKITADPEFKEDADTSEMPVDPDLPFEVKSSFSDGSFEVSIQGRMDTITAPQVLKQFQEVGEGISAIHVDVSKMAYVSSAGLRVLLMMYKSLEDKDKFKMTGISAAVREIIKTTGFDEFFIKT